ncbi:glycosyl hydrolase family 28-related protein [Hymenobacter weizhouensis]|uniref:glycosyl hydrolase family 28-related protein n=1 Tax=Hymenobacter sp. YIM 151500-1 TaxID=2987689 RepID=UPI0022270A70|nr:glycosyl hydrolase family 28-related protein [Hymenobacter sp. YIM 151500-1]UYZ64725.1 T9SS type A sorting domain-containing protein [Hymenobacter sp. YIM 151500-1]
MKHRFFLLLLWPWLWLLPGRGQAQTTVYPAGAGVVNVKAAPYNAKGDGTTDDTQALQKAITDNLGRTIYLPAGTYLVSNRLEARSADGKWNCGLRLIGQSQASTIIKLKDNAAGYNAPATPRAVVYTASSLFVEQPYGGGKDYPGLGEGNEAFSNYVQHLTVDVGQGNAGAIGLDYLCNNVGAVRDVTIRGSGFTGLSLLRKWPGPCLVKNLTVQGFEYGIQADHFQYSITLEHITLSGQSKAGIRNVDNALFIRDLRSTNSVPAVLNNAGGNGFVVLVDAALQGGAGGVSAIENTGKLLLRNVRAAGYRSALASGGAVVPGVTLAEYTSEPARTPGAGGSGATLNLPVQDTPEYDEPTLTNWANVVDYGANLSSSDWNDDFQAVQAALNSGKPVVYLPAGRCFISGTLLVPPTVRKVIGFGTTLAPTWAAFPDAANPKALFRVQGAAATPVIFEGFGIDKLHQGSPQPGLVGWENATTRAVVLKDVSVGESKYAYRSLPGAGPLFIENAVAGQWYFGPGQQVWARQYNAEGGAQKITNDGGRLWILGLKTEGGDTVIETKGGGKTELLGGLLYPATNVSSADVAFTSTDSEVSLSFVTVAYSAGADYATHIRETRGGSTYTLGRGQLTGRGIGVVVPLYSSARSTPLAATTATPAAAALALYPNPARETVHLRDAPALTDVTLLDGLGRVVRRYPTGTPYLSVRGLPTGLYVLRATAQGRPLSRRLVVE